MQTTEFLLLPKIHKASTPGRSVISSGKVSEFVDYYLKSEIKRRKCYRYYGFY